MKISILFSLNFKHFVANCVLHYLKLLQVKLEIYATDW